MKNRMSTALFLLITIISSLQMLNCSIPSTQEGRQIEYERVKSRIEELQAEKDALDKRGDECNKEANRLMFTDAIGSRIQMIEADRCRNKSKAIDLQLKDLDKQKKRLEMHLK